MVKPSRQWPTFLIGVLAIFTMGCTSNAKAPAGADMAVSAAAIESAASADGAQFAPVEMSMAREKMVRARQAMEAGDYKQASDLANQAEADAKLAQSKASSAKAQIAADALKDDIRVLREELNRPRR